MKRLTTVLFCIGFAAASLLLPIDLYAQTENAEGASGSGAAKIPRRVLVQYTPSPDAAVEDEEYLAWVPEFVYTAVSSRRPVVRVQEQERAHNRLQVNVDGGSEVYSLELLLEEKQEEQWIERFRDSTEFRGDREDLRRFIEDCADTMSQHLPLVEPEIRINVRVQDEGVRRMVEQVDFADRLDTPFELTAWAVNLTTDFSYDVGVYRFNVVPLTLDAAWFPGREHGLVAQMFLDYVDLFGDGAGDFAVLPGLGYRFRLLDRISAAFSIGLSAGAGIGEQVQFMSLFWVYPSVTWNITERLGLSYRFASYVDPVLLVGEGDGPQTDYDGFFLQYVSIGFVWRLGQPRQ
ncbi:MAG: hypothetical protein K9L68_01985 [Spirochaetales bacterium]|nr:hypothetical protein [Spirochaetales bacterium]MCF7937348.1 hypothetical protein [Spirochaetales bacterium]